MKWQWRLLAILAIIGLEAFALSRDIDGVAIAIAILILAGLGGYDFFNFPWRRG